VAEMTTDEKYSMMFDHAHEMWEGYTPAIPRLGIPALKLNDGPAGFRYDIYGSTNTATQFPSVIKVGATWNKLTARYYG